MKITELFENDETVKDAKVIMDQMSGYLADLIPELSFEFSALYPYKNKSYTYTGFFIWERDDNKHGKGTVTFSCYVHGKKVQDIKIYDLTGGFGVSIDPSIFSDMIEE